MAAFRFTTAGESHGPGLVAIVEGLPAGLELDRERARPRDGTPPARPRPRRADEDRARRGRGALGDPPRAHARQPGRDAGREPRLRELGGADEPLAGRRRGRGVAPAATRATPTSSGRRSTGIATSATFSSAPAPARPPPGWPPARLRRSSSRRSASASIATCCGSPRWRRPSAIDLDRGGLRRRRRVAGPLPGRRGRRADGRRDRPAAEAEREPRRRCSRSAPSASCPGSAPTSPGTSASTAASPGGGLDPGRQGRLGGRGVGGRGAAGFASHTTRSSGRTSAAITASRTTPAASKAGCRTASRSSSAAALKPISTLTKPLRSVDTETKQPAQAMRERTDSTVVPAAGVVGEAMVALVLARAATARSSAATTSTTFSPPLQAYRERIDWRR